ncbi:MAG: transposase, partial [Ignavibacteriaceae bacterium]|nr:transposase [Ignavibacteriaceae bacterium]
KKGAKSYHPLLAFASELKIVVHNRFRTGSAYTSNGILSFVKQIVEILPKEIEKIFFRADSGFFNGRLFDQTERVPLYQYACYCSNLELAPAALHKKYKERSTSENWIEQVKKSTFSWKNINE